MDETWKLADKFDGRVTITDVSLTIAPGEVHD